MLERYAALREAVEAELQRFFDEELAERDYTSSFYRKVHEHLARFTLEGGKKFRPVLFLLASKAYGLDEHNLLSLAASLELAHAFRIIHDDIIDKDEQRRGKPALHLQLNKLLPSKDQASTELGILAGDLILLFAWKLMSKTPLEDALLRKAWQRMLEALINTIIGQVYDVHDTFKPISRVKHEHVLFTHTYKTAKYSFDLPLTLAAIISQHEEDIPTLEEAASLIGIAYQLQDDYLSLYGNPSKLGKPVESDIIHAKKTLILKWAYDAASRKDKERLRSLLGKHVSPDEFEWIRNLVESTGVKARIEEYIHDLYEEGISMLDETRMQKDEREGLKAFLRMIRQRTY